MGYIINNSQAQEAIANVEPFSNSGGTLRGQRTQLPDSIMIYEVFSYAQPIARAEFDHGKATLVWITPNKYSVTTSKHTGIARRGLDRFRADRYIK